MLIIKTFGTLSEKMFNYNPTNRPYPGYKYMMVATSQGTLKSSGGVDKRGLSKNQLKMGQTLHIRI